ncbi:hypothetical protein G6F56_013385 [Rhizopus delemar]|nr:hypothetical protein G6F56_013385 [Rhizopus delemar]
MTIILLLYFTTLTLVSCLGYQHPFSSGKSHEHSLKLKHIYHHASANGPIPKLFRRHDVKSSVMIQDNYPLRSMFGTIERPTAADINEFLASNHRWNNKIRSMYLESSVSLMPNIEHRGSILALAQMTNNAYLDINLNETDWYDLGPRWQV